MGRIAEERDPPAAPPRQGILVHHRELEDRVRGAHQGRHVQPVEAPILESADEIVEATARIVLTNRTNPPDAILREVFVRTGDRPFERIEDVISPGELAAISDGYKRVAGYDRVT